LAEEKKNSHAEENVAFEQQNAQLLVNGHKFHSSVSGTIKKILGIAEFRPFSELLLRFIETGAMVFS